MFIPNPKRREIVSRFKDTFTNSSPFEMRAFI